MAIERETLTECGICGESLIDSGTVVHVPDNFGVSDETFRYVRCSGCRTWVQNPRPVVDEIAQFYQADFLVDRPATERSAIGRLALWCRDVTVYGSSVKLTLDQVKEGGRYLDYSTGDGEAVLLARKHRPDVEVYATEFSDPLREIVTQRSPDIDVRKDLDDFGPDELFDTISVLSVLEHVYSPEDLLQQVHARLVHGGKLVIDVPNPESYQLALTRENWWTWLAPRHMYLMDLRTLVDLLERTGFEPVKQKHFHFRNGVPALVLSFFPGLMPTKASRARLFLFGVLILLAVPCEWVASWFKKSGFMTVVALKQ
jgi:SAM-dependent methyltransferase